MEDERLIQDLCASVTAYARRVVALEEEILRLREENDRLQVLLVAPLCNHRCPNSSKYMCTLFPNHLGGHRAFDRVTGSVIDWPAGVREEEAEE